MRQHPPQEMRTAPTLRALSPLLPPCWSLWDMVRGASCAKIWIQVPITNHFFTTNFSPIGELNDWQVGRRRLWWTLVPVLRFPKIRGILQKQGMANHMLMRWWCHCLDTLEAIYPSQMRHERFKSEIAGTRLCVVNKAVSCNWAGVCSTAWGLWVACQPHYHWPPLWPLWWDRV